VRRHFLSQLGDQDLRALAEALNAVVASAGQRASASPPV
jgi:hypothetical protein